MIFELTLLLTEAILPKNLSINNFVDIFIDFLNYISCQFYLMNNSESDVMKDSWPKVHDQGIPD